MLSSSRCKTAFLVGLLTLGLPAVYADNYDWKWGQPKENCDFGDYASGIGIGSGAGYEICLSKHNKGVLMKKIEFQGDHQAVRGIIVTWTDGSSDYVGSLDYRGDKTRKQTLEWDPTKEHLTQLELWDTARGGTKGGIGRVRIATSGGKSVDLANDYSDQPATWSGDLNDGSLLGLYGKADWAIDSLYFIVSNSKLRKLSVVDMELSPTLEELNSRPPNERGFTMKSISEWEFSNTNLKNPAEYGMSKTYETSKGTSITKSTSDSFSFGTEFSFTASMGVPEVADFEVSTSTNMQWEKTEEVTQGTESIEKDSIVVNAKIQLNAGESASCQAIAYFGQTVDVTWSGKIEMEFKDGKKHTFASDGEYSSVGHTKSVLTCKSTTGEKVPWLPNNGELKDKEEKVLPAPEKPTSAGPADSTVTPAARPTGAKFRYGDLLDSLSDILRGLDREDDSKQ